MIIIYAVGPSLLFVTWCSASKHWRERIKMADESERKWNLLEVSKPYNESGRKWNLLEVLKPYN